MPDASCLSRHGLSGPSITPVACDAPGGKRMASTQTKQGSAGRTGQSNWPCFLGSSSLIYFQSLIYCCREAANAKEKAHRSRVREEQRREKGERGVRACICVHVLLLTLEWFMAISIHCAIMASSRARYQWLASCKRDVEYKAGSSLLFTLSK